MKNLENQLRNTLHACADHIVAPDTLKTRIDFAINNQPAARRKVSVWKRAAIGMAAVVCFATIGAFARGHVAGLVTSLNFTHERADIAALQQDIDKTFSGTEIALPAALGSHAFTKGSIDYTDKLDGDGNRFGAFPSVDVSYGAGLTYTARLYDAELDAGEDKLFDEQPFEVREIDDVSVTYRSDDYLFIPEGYTLTAEEQALMDANKLQVSVGSDAREEETFQHVTWQIGDVVYTINSFDTSFSAENLFAFAEEIISNQ